MRIFSALKKFSHYLSLYYAEPNNIYSCADIYCFDSYLTNFHATNILSLILKPISCTFKTETDENWLKHFQHLFSNTIIITSVRPGSGLMTYKADIEDWISSSHFNRMLNFPDSESRAWLLCTIWSSHGHSPEFSRPRPVLDSVLLCTHSHKDQRKLSSPFQSFALIFLASLPYCRV